MENDTYRSLENRIEALEKGLLRIEQKLYNQSQSSQIEAQKALDELAAAKSRPKRSATSASITETAVGILDRLRNTEGWLGKVGIALLLFGLVFLFKYAVDQGWLTPAIRLFFGLALGLVLLVLSFRIYEARRHFSLLLFGGGVVAFYVTGFAAFQIFELVPYPAALGFMIGVTVLTLFISVRQSEALPALLGAIGGFLTPFLLHVEPGSLPGLVGYTCILIAGSLAVYFYRGWRPLFWLTFVGSGLVLGFALVTGFVVTSVKNPADRLPMQLGLIAAWLMFAVLPIAREAVISRPNSPFPPTVPGLRTKDVSRRITRYLRQHLNLFSPALALLAVGLSTPVYELGKITWGWLTMGLALVYGAVAYAMYHRDSIKEYATAHGATALIFFTIALTLLFDNHERMLVLGLEAMMILVVAGRYKNEPLRIAGHVLFFVLAFSMLERLFATDYRNMVVLNPRAIVDLILFAMALYGASRLPSIRQRSIYHVIVHLAFLVWFVRELDSLQHGQGLITICWGVYAVLLVVSGLHFNVKLLRSLGVGTLLLVVGKLFLVDLSTLDTLWRILLFLGFGGVFLLLSYFFRTLWRKGDD